VQLIEGLWLKLQGVLVLRHVLQGQSDPQGCPAFIGIVDSFHGDSGRIVTVREVEGGFGW